MTAAAFRARFESVRRIARRADEVTFTSNGCWQWPSESYASIWFDDRTIGLHRLSLQLATGRDLEPQEFACHHCDNPPCCNPAHLFIGTRSDNARDAMRKGRAVAPPRVVGLANGNARLTDAQIVEALLLSSTGASDAVVAGRFGVSKAAVAAWRNGRMRRAALATFLKVSDDTGSRNGGKPCRELRLTSSATTPAPRGS